MVDAVTGWWGGTVSMKVSGMTVARGSAPPLFSDRTHAILTASAAVSHLTMRGRAIYGMVGRDERFSSTVNGHLHRTDNASTETCSRKLPIT